MHPLSVWWKRMIDLRAPTEEDRLHFIKAVFEDPHHPERTRKDQQDKILDWAGPNTQTMTFYDENGQILHLRVTRALRIEVQFDAAAGQERTGAALMSLFEWLKVTAHKAGFRELLFESTFRPLIAFCKDKMGFKPSPDEQKYVI